jgi:SseB protein N-terminal domain
MRSLPDPGFAGDDGSADPELLRALATYAADPDGRHLDVLTVLQGARVLVPVVAVAGEVEVDAAGLTHDKTSDMAAVLMRGHDGRTALLAFSGTQTLAAWDPAARPVPVTARDAARAARQDGAEALVLDVAGPVLFVVEGEDLVAVAEGWTLATLSGRRAWVRPDR